MFIKIKEMLLHVAITIHSPKEIENFYKKVLLFNVQKKFSLNKETSQKIFSTEEVVDVYLMEHQSVQFEIFISYKKGKKQFSHVCLAYRQTNTIYEKAISSISNLDSLYENGNITQKRKIIGSVFPEKLTFDGIRFRTTRINEAIEYIQLMDNELGGNKNGTNSSILNLSRKVNLEGLEPPTFWSVARCSIH